MGVSSCLVVVSGLESLKCTLFQGDAPHSRSLLPSIDLGTVKFYTTATETPGSSYSRAGRTCAHLMDLGVPDGNYYLDPVGKGVYTDMARVTCDMVRGVTLFCGLHSYRLYCDMSAHFLLGLRFFFIFSFSMSWFNHFWPYAFHISSHNPPIPFPSVPSSPQLRPIVTPRQLIT